MRLPCEAAAWGASLTALERQKRALSRVSEAIELRGPLSSATKPHRLTKWLKTHKAARRRLRRDGSRVWREREQRVRRCGARTAAGRPGSERQPSSTGAARRPNICCTESRSAACVAISNGDLPGSCVRDLGSSGGGGSNAAAARRQRARCARAAAGCFRSPRRPCQPNVHSVGVWFSSVTAHY